MITVTITREPSTDDGTFGRLHVEHDGATFECDTLELPWKHNQRNISCIPLGTYPVDWSHSAKFGACYRLRDVPERAGILIHAGNFAGDRTKMRKADVEGCILLGMFRGTLGGQRMIARSRHAVAAFVEFLGEKPFRLVINPT